MKVKCINADCSFLTLNKIYAVHLDDYLQAYVVDDTNGEYLIGYENHYLEKVQDNTTAKNLRDEFAMAVINAMGHQHDYRKIVEYTALAEAAYEMADAMLEVRNENEQTKE